MSGAYLHLLLNHFPVMGMFFSVAFLIVAMFTRNQHTYKAALYLILFTALMTIPVYLSGDPAEAVIDHLPTFSEKLLSAHEKFAEKAAWLIWVNGALAVIGLCFALTQKKLPAWLSPLLLLLSLASLAAAAWTNKLGGKISHVELREDGVLNAGDADEKETDRD